VIEYYTKFQETFNINYIIQKFRLIRAKVISQEGNSPDRKIRYLKITKSEDLIKIHYLGDRLGSSHSLKKE
jgi:hypothetical protein